MNQNNDYYEKLICQQVPHEDNIIATYYLETLENKYDLFILA